MTIIGDIQAKTVLAAGRMAENRSANQIAIAAFVWRGAKAVAYGAICSLSLIQNSAVPEMRGRIVSLVSSLGVGGAALGALALGWIANIAGLRVPLVVAGGAALLLLAWSARQALSQSRALEDAPEAEPAKI